MLLYPLLLFFIKRATWSSLLSFTCQWIDVMRTGMHFGSWSFLPICLTYLWSVQKWYLMV